jgi:AhpC/TSA family
MSRAEHRASVDQKEDPMAQTILYGNQITTIDGARAEGDHLWIPLAELERSTGWKLEPQGLCRGDVCVPIPPDRKHDWVDEGRGQLDLAAFAGHLGEPAVHDVGQDAWSFGPAMTGRGGSEGQQGSGPVPAPDFALPDLDGKLHSLSAYRGRKVFLFCWASW